jgi:hypothetical protein
MEHVLAGYPTAPVVVMVLDNVIIHRSKKVQAWLRTHPRMRLVYGARYSPHHNPVERIWGALKAALANRPTLTIAGRIRQVHAFFRQHSSEQLLATAAPHSSPWLPDRQIAPQAGRLAVRAAERLGTAKGLDERGERGGKLDVLPDLLVDPDDRRLTLTTARAVIQRDPPVPIA